VHVTRAAKGGVGPIAELWSDAMTSCSFRLTEGERYVIYVA
jgi:hypothetical protein